MIHLQVVAAREGREPRVAARLSSGWVLFGERQFVRGYVLLLPDPVVPPSMRSGRRSAAQFLLDMARLGDALLKVTNALRINYAILGNLEPALHAHVIPRYADEPEALRTRAPLGARLAGCAAVRPRRAGRPGRCAAPRAHAHGSCAGHALRPGVNAAC